MSKEELNLDYQKAFEVFKETMREGDYILAVKYALEKQIPKKPKYIDGDYDLPLCPSCGLSVDEDRDMYCSICGQALDWSDSE